MGHTLCQPEKYHGHQVASESRIDEGGGKRDEGGWSQYDLEAEPAQVIVVVIAIPSLHLSPRRANRGDPTTKRKQYVGDHFVPCLLPGWMQSVVGQVTHPVRRAVDPPHCKAGYVRLDARKFDYSKLSMPMVFTFWKQNGS